MPVGKGHPSALQGKDYDCNFMDSAWSGAEVKTEKRTSNFNAVFGTTDEVGTDGSGGPN